MSEIWEKLDRIERLVTKKKNPFAFIDTVLVPLAVAGVAAFVSVYTLQKNTAEGDAERDLKRVEVVSSIIKDFSSQNPEQTVLLLSVVKSANILDTDTSDKLEEYALTLTKDKLQEAIDVGGENSAKTIENTVSIISAANSPKSNALSSEISKTKFHVIAASNTTLELANAFKKQLISAGFSGAQVIKTSIRYAISIAYLPLEEAKKVEVKFKSMPRFHSDHSNDAYIEAQKPHWVIVE